MLAAVTTQRLVSRDFLPCVYIQACLLALNLFCLSSTKSGRNCSCVPWRSSAQGLLNLNNCFGQDAVPACFYQSVLDVCFFQHPLLALAASSRNCSWTPQSALKCSWCVPLQLPSPCYDSVHNPRVLHMQCVTCILPHLGLQITPGNVACQQTCALLGTTSSLSLLPS